MARDGRCAKLVVGTKRPLEVSWSTVYLVRGRGRDRVRVGVRVRVRVVVGVGVGVGVG